MPLGTAVSLGPGDISLDRDPVPRRKGAQQPPTFRVMSIVVNVRPSQQPLSSGYYRRLTGIGMRSVEWRNFQSPLVILITLYHPSYFYFSRRLSFLRRGRPVPLCAAAAAISGNSVTPSLTVRVRRTAAADVFTARAMLAFQALY